MNRRLSQLFLLIGIISLTSSCLAYRTRTTITVEAYQETDIIYKSSPDSHKDEQNLDPPFVKQGLPKRIYIERTEMQQKIQTALSASRFWEIVERKQDAAYIVWADLKPADRDLFTLDLIVEYREGSLMPWSKKITGNRADVVKELEANLLPNPVVRSFGTKYIEEKVVLTKYRINKAQMTSLDFGETFVNGLYCLGIIMGIFFMQVGK